MNGTFLIFATFLAAVIEGVEMMAILVGVGATRGWRSTLMGALAGFALLAAATLLLGNALLRIPIQGLRVVVGSLLLILGLQWLKKALLRLARPRAGKNAPAEVESTGELYGIDWYAFVVAFKAVMLEGLEIVFIVVTFGAEANQFGLAAGSAIAALVAVGGIAFLTRRWLLRIPREWLRFGVGVILSVFGMFWAAEGAGVRWPGGDWSLAWLLAIMTLTAFSYRALLRSREPTRADQSL
jgi:uncharacterized membrane protein